MIFKVDNRPIRIGNGKWLGLCKNFEECESYVVREKDAKVYTCYRCRQRKPREYTETIRALSGALSLQRIRKSMIHALAVEVGFLETAVKNGRFTKDEAYDELMEYVKEEMLTMP